MSQTGLFCIARGLSAARVGAEVGRECREGLWRYGDAIASFVFGESPSASLRELVLSLAGWARTTRPSQGAAGVCRSTLNTFSLRRRLDSAACAAPPQSGSRKAGSRGKLRTANFLGFRPFLAWPGVLDLPQLDPEFVSEALAAQLCSHRAMDVPKHYGAEVVLALANELRDEALAASPERVSAVCAKELRVQLRLRKDQTFEHFEAQLQQAVGRSAPMGRIWLPADEVALGAEARREVLADGPGLEIL